MSENAMQQLRELLNPLATGPRLANALESANLGNTELPMLIKSVIDEAVQGRSGTAAAGEQRLSLGSALTVIDGLMFLNPRGKQQLALFPDRCVIKTAKADIAVPYSAIQHVAIIDSIPGDTKGKVLLYLHLSGEHKVMNGKTALTGVVIQTTADAQLDVVHPQGAGRLAGPAPVVLCQALGAVPGGVHPTCFVSPDAHYFQSADKAAGVGAFVKARQGFLYPLPSAICFLEAPALFLPHSSIRSVELMRAGGGSSTFDLVVHTKGGAAHEFGMISRSEVAGIEDYIRKCRLAVGAAETSDEEDGEQGAGSMQDKGKAAAAGGDSEADDDSDDPEDEDFNPSSSSDEEEEGEGEEGAGGSSKQRSRGSTKRKRSEAAGGSEGAGGAASAAGEGEEEEEEESSSSGSSSEGESDSDSGDVELVSEDEFSTGQLRSMMASESSGGRRHGAKRQRS